MRVSRHLLLASAALLSACAAGPDFEPPAAPQTTSYDSEATPAKTAAAKDPYGASQTLQHGETLPAQWWQMFQSPALNRMIAEALLHNPDLQASQAALRAADEDYAAGEGELLPVIGGSFSSTRQKVSGASYGGDFPSTIYTLHNASVNVSYGLDLFGGTRRAIEQLGAERDYQAYQLEAARITLTANVVTTAIREASLRGQIAATKELIDEEQKQADIYKKQLDAGAVNKLALLSQQTTVLQTRATLPPMEQQLSAARHELSVLLGHLPSEAPGDIFELSSMHLPDAIPLSMPSRLVEQRPDIKEAEAEMHAASAAIGVAEANRLPQITLSADIGSVANELSKLFSPGGGIWAISGSIGQTIFDAGTLGHEQNAAEAQYDQTAAQYRKTVLMAFQNVADTLRALETDADTLREQSDAERAAAESLKLAHMQFESGSISYLNMIDAENAEQKARVAVVTAEAQRFADTAALFQALGGGWNGAIQPHDFTPSVKDLLP